MAYRLVFAAVFLALNVAPALAQGGSPVSVTGTVVTFDSASVAVRNDAGEGTETFKLAPNLLVVENKPATLGDIRPNDFVASAAMRGTDGKFHSTELRIFPEAMRGLGEGQRPMNDPRNQVMTNALVTGTAVADGVNTLKVKFPGGESELVLEPGVPVTRIDVADRSRIAPGTKVRVQGTRTAEGATASRITLQP